ncbi:MAG: hypothetical protein ABJB05_10020 [Parafilimonas sp.]
MTVSKTYKPNWRIAIGIPGVIFLACFFITLTAKFKNNNELLSNAILIDVLVVAPLIYFLAIRKSNISKFTASRVFIAGLLVAGFILNAQPNPFLQFIRTWVSPLNIVSSEIAVLYYAFIGSRDKTIDYETRFTAYKENGTTIVLWVILSIFLIETTGVHFLLRLWSNTAAWVITALSLYTCIQLYAHIKAIKARPVIINKNSLEIHNGLAGDAYIMLDNIEKFELSKKIPQGRNPIKIALLKGIENHNVIVYLKNSIEVTKIFGIKKTTNTVLFYVDKSIEFSNALTRHLANKNC